MKPKFDQPTRTRLALERIAETARFSVEAGKRLAADAPNSEPGDLPHWHVLPWPEPVDGHELLNDLAAAAKQCLVLQAHAAEALALWVMHAWTFDAADTSPFLALLSPTRGCGKSHTLAWLFWLAPRSVIAASISPAAVFRFVEATRPTLLLDEFDGYGKADKGLHNVLNSGHTKIAAGVVRCDGAEKQPRVFSTWSPKVIAAIGSLPTTILDRSVVVRMRRKLAHEITERSPLRDDAIFQGLRQRALRWATDNGALLETADPAMPDGLINRPADNWRPLLCIADLAGGDWPDRARAAASALSCALETDQGVVLLADVRQVFGETGAEALGGRALTDALIRLPDASYATDWRGRKLSAKALHQALDLFGIEPERSAKARLYHRADFDDAYRRYLPPEDVD